MNLHQEWMTNNTLFGDDYSKNLTVSLVGERFNKQRYESTEGFAVLIDGIEQQVIIQTHVNPNNINKEDLKIFAPLNSGLKEVH